MAKHTSGEVVLAGFGESRPALVIGLMSGTSLDGVDLCACQLQVSASGQWNFEIIAAETISYPAIWHARLDEVMYKKEEELAELDASLAELYAEMIGEFCQKHGLKPDLIASHGHTVHHQPERRYTRQIGDPSIIAEQLDCICIGDFRTSNVKAGGQGAPLVPVADKLLFGEYLACINLGGIVNISFEADGKRMAGDLTVCNLLLNRLASRAGELYDDEGRLAARGMVVPEILNRLNSLSYLKLPMPKSIGREWIEDLVWPIFAESSANTPDLLASAVEHIASQIGASCQGIGSGKVLLSGGGARNTFLRNRIKANLKMGQDLAEVSEQIIDFKEALAFALLGALRMRGEVNVLASVTGAHADSSDGRVCFPASKAVAG